jgi:hypothetical protein
MRVRNLRIMIEWPAAKGPLRDGLTPDTAAETVNAITSPHVYGLLTRERRSRRRFEGRLSPPLGSVCCRGGRGWLTLRRAISPF